VAAAGDVRLTIHDDVAFHEFLYVSGVIAAPPPCTRSPKPAP
jgi:hypothetical protein